LHALIHKSNYMNKKLYIALFMACCFSAQGFTPVSNNSTTSGDLKGKITISGAFALYPLAVKWGEEFKKLHPDVDFDIQGGGAGKGMTDVLSGTVNLGMVSREISKEESAQGAIGYAMCKDAVVATMNVKNPYYQKIYQTGITRAQFEKIWIDGSITTWGELLNTSAAEKISVFTRSDAAGAADAWVKYISSGTKKQEDLKGVCVFGDPGVAEAVAVDKFSIGYNNIGFAYDPVTKKPADGIGIVPIDLNGNGKLDPEENFYSTKDKITLAILAEEYPSPPARQLYFVSKGNITDPLVKAFLLWALTDGQKYVAEAGYVGLPDALLKEQVAKLN